MRYGNFINYLIGALFVLTGCATIPQKPNYVDDNSWVAKSISISKPVDVFYVYPTIHVAETPPNMDVSDPQLRKNAEGLLIAQAGIYSPYANLFAPFYRQQSAATQSMEPNNGGRDAFADPLFLTGYHDVERAFDYYIEHLNPDRPFIFAGHSQGSNGLLRKFSSVLPVPTSAKEEVQGYALS